MVEMPPSYSATAPSPTPHPEQKAPADRRAELRTGGLVVAALALLGAVLGVIWELWSPPGPLGVRLPGGVQADETETFAAGDGRFALITAVVGILVGIAAWYLRRVRGAVMAVALVLGGLAGAAMTELIGWALRGRSSGRPCGPGLTCFEHLPLTVHMHAVLLTEATLAVLVYALFVAFAAADDLGRPDRPAPDRVEDVMVAAPGDPS